MIVDITLTKQEVDRLLMLLPEGDSLREKLTPLSAGDDEARFIIETVTPSFMSKQERLDDLKRLMTLIRQQNVPPSKYRKDNQRKIAGAVEMARTLFW